MSRKYKRRWFIVEVDEPEVKAKSWIIEFRKKKLNYILFWIPSINVCRLIDGIWTDAKEPLLPGYLLVSSRNGFRYIEQLLGMDLLCFGNTPNFLSYTDIEKLKYYESVSYFSLDYVFRPGEIVRIHEKARSSYIGMKGVFLCLVNNCNGFYARVQLLLYESKNIVINIPYDHLVPCTEENLQEVKESQERLLWSQDGIWIGSVLLMMNPSIHRHGFIHRHGKI